MSWWMLWLVAGMAVVWFNKKFWDRMKAKGGCECQECRGRRSGL